MDNRIEERRLSLNVGDKIGRVDLAYLMRAGSGTALVFIHGMGSSRLAYQPLMESWPGSNPLYAIDLPGFGASSLPRRRQVLPDFVHAVSALVDDLGLSPVVLIGHSFGGMVAAETAIWRRQRLAGVVLVASAGWFPPVNAFEPTRSVCINRIGIWITGSDFFGMRIAQGLGLDPAKVSARDRARMRYGWRRAREMARMGHFYETSALAERLRQSDVPAIAIAGDRDPLFPVERVRVELAGRIPLWVTEGAGHLLFDHDLPAFEGQLRHALTAIDEGNRQRNGGR